MGHLPGAAEVAPRSLEAFAFPVENRAVLGAPYPNTLLRSLNMFQFVIPSSGEPELDAVFQKWACECCSGWDEHLPQSAGSQLDPVQTEMYQHPTELLPIQPYSGVHLPFPALLWVEAPTSKM